MTLDWKKVGDELPQDGDNCLLYGEDGGMRGPILWHGESGTWMDLFFGPLSTEEAGTMILPNTPGLTHWAIVNEPDEELAPKEEKYGGA